MNTAVPREHEEEPALLLPPIPWTLYTYEWGEDGVYAESGIYSSHDGLLWSDISHSETHDGFTLSMTNANAYKLWLDISGSGGEKLRIEPPYATPMFGFTRYAQSFMGEARWLYSAFGYVLPDYLFLTRIFPGTPTRILEQRLFKRPCVFPF